IWMRLLVDSACTVAFLCPQSGPNHSRDDFPLRISRSFLRSSCWSLAVAMREPFTLTFATRILQRGRYKLPFRSRARDRICFFAPCLGLSGSIFLSCPRLFTRGCVHSVLRHFAYTFEHRI